MVSMTKDHPRIEPTQHGSAKSNVYVKDCSTCEHDTSSFVICKHEDFRTKKFDKMTMEECHSDSGKAKKKRGKSVTNLKVNR